MLEKNFVKMGKVELARMLFHKAAEKVHHPKNIAESGVQAEVSKKRAKQVELWRDRLTALKKAPTQGTTND